MNANIEDFMAKVQPKYKLRKYSDDIQILIHEGYTQSDILDYLKEYYEVKVSRQTLSTHLTFLKKTNKNQKGKSSSNSSTKISESDKMKGYERLKKLGESN